MIKAKVELEIEAENFNEISEFFARLSGVNCTVTSTATLTTVETKPEKPKPSKAEKQQGKAAETTSVVPIETPAKPDPVNADTVNTPPAETKTTGTKLIGEDGTPLTKEDEIDAARAYLRSIAKPANEAGHVDEVRAAVASLGGAKSITLMDPKYFPELEKKILGIHTKS